jgi:hypothetical protein
MDSFFTDSLIPNKINFFNLEIENIFFSFSYFNEFFLVSKYFYDIYVIKGTFIGLVNLPSSYSIKEPTYVNYYCFGKDFLSGCGSNGKCIETDNCAC